MSRIAKRAINIPTNVKIILHNQNIIVTGINEKLHFAINNQVKVTCLNNTIVFKGRSEYNNSWMHAGTARSLVQSMIVGVTIGFTKKLIFVGVGYRVVLKNKNVLNMSLGFSHTINYTVPKGVSVNLLSSTEITLKSSNKQLLGQVAANIRSYRKPESYKGKGIRYEHEIIRIKEAKKK